MVMKGNVILVNFPFTDLSKQSFVLQLFCGSTRWVTMLSFVQSPLKTQINLMKENFYWMLPIWNFHKQD